MMNELFGRFARAHQVTIGVYIAIMCVITVERVAIPHFYGKMLDHLKSKRFDATAKIFGVLVLIYFAFQVLETILTLLDAKLLPLLEAFVRENVVDTIVQRHSEHYRELDLGNITSKLIKLPSNLRALFYHVKVFLFTHVLAVLITGGYLYYCHWTLGAIFMSTFILLALITWHFCTHCSPLSYAREDAFDTMQEQIQDILYNLLSVYNNQSEKQEHGVVDRANQETVRRTRDHIYCGIPYRVVFSLIFIVIFAGTTWKSIDLYRSNTIEPSTLISSFIVMFSMLKIGRGFYYDFESFVYLYGGIKVVSDYIERMPRSCTRRGKRGIPVAPRGGIDIEFDNVTFSYQQDQLPNHASRPQPIFHRLRLRIPAKQRLAVMGGIGSGKSSLAQLLLRLQCHQSGTIYLNGRDTAQIDTHAIRRRITYVPQHPRLFDRTLWDNLAYENKTLRPHDVYAMLQKLGMRDLERSFRQKMFDSVGKQGSHLSGGQRQMVWLLRALFDHRTEVLILDEPTSSLDKRSRAQIQRVIEQISHNRTLIIITHDEDLLTLADRVVRLEQGVITHDQVVQR